MKTEPCTALSYTITDALQSSLLQCHETQARINARLHSLTYRLLGIEQVQSAESGYPAPQGTIPNIQLLISDLANLQDQTEVAISALENL